MRISDWSSDVCSSDLRSQRTGERCAVAAAGVGDQYFANALCVPWQQCGQAFSVVAFVEDVAADDQVETAEAVVRRIPAQRAIGHGRKFVERGVVGEEGFRQRVVVAGDHVRAPRSEEHTSELQSLMRSSYAVFCLKKKN